MIRNIYFKAKCCGSTEIRYVDDKFIDTVKKNLHCACGQNNWEETTELAQTTTDNVKTGRLVDHRAYDKNAYMSSDYKAKRAQINDFHREKTGFSKFKD